MALLKKRTNDNTNAVGEKKAKFDKTVRKTKFDKPVEKTKFDKPVEKTNLFSDKNKQDNKEGNVAGKTNLDNKFKVNAQKTDWNKLKDDKKKLKLKRKQNNTLFELSVQAKKIYEKLKCKGTPNKEELAKELHKLVRGENNYQKLVLAHDTARVVQCMLKYAPSDIRREISENLVTILDQISISKYAHFCVLRMIKYGTPDIKQKVIEGTFGNIIKFIKNVYASTIIDTIYVSWASSQQKAFMRQELYGDLYKKSKDNSVKCIKDTYINSEHMKMAILNAVKTNLLAVVTKKFIDNSLIHSVLLDFLNESAEEDRTEMVAAYSPYIPSLSSTKDGVRAATICFWQSIVKDRRAIVKNLKEHLIKLCTHEYGHLLILAIINSMDDTKGLKKSIFDPIFAQIEFVSSNEWGRKIIDWLVVPEDTSLFHPQMISLLEDGLKFSKKDKETRRKEIFEVILEPICETICKNPKFWLRGGHTALTTAAILKNIKSEQLKIVYGKLAEVLCDTNWKVNQREYAEKLEEEKIAIETQKKIVKKYSTNAVKDNAPKDEAILGIEHAGLHIALKKMIKFDLEKQKNNLPTFGEAILENITKETIELWLSLNRPTFLLLNIYENGTETTQNELKKLIVENKKLLKKQTHVGAKILMEKLVLKQ